MPPLGLTDENENSAVDIALANVLQNLTDKRPLGIAVSGGSDSLGLLYGMTRACARNRLVALTVDHRLRACSTQEAGWVKSVCRQFGVRHETLTWHGEKPFSGLQAKARAARYRLIGQAASRLGLAAVLTAHTSDDQRETLVMRHSRNPQEGAPGLAGIPPASLFDARMWVLRPLLGVSRAQIRAQLEAARIEWLDDPTNLDSRFERVRVRTALKTDPLPSLSSHNRQSAVTRSLLAREVASFIAGNCQMQANGTVRVALKGNCHDSILTSALEAVIAFCGGASRSIDRHGKAALQAFVGARIDGSTLTLGRTLLRHQSTALLLYRERRGLVDGLIAPGETACWDGRFLISNLDREQELIVTAKAEPGAMPLFHRKPDGKLQSWSAADGVIGGFQLERLAGRFSRVLPIFELPVADALARLAGATPFTACPWAMPLAIETFVP